MATLLEEKVKQEPGTIDVPPEPKEDRGDNDPRNPFNVVLIGTQENPKDKVKKYGKIHWSLVKEMYKELSLPWTDRIFNWLDWGEKKAFYEAQKYNFAILTTPLPILRTADNYQIDDFRFLSIDENNNLHRRIFDYGIISKVDNLWYFLFLKDKTGSFSKNIISPRELLEVAHKDFWTDEHVDDALEAWNKIFHVKVSGNPLVFSQSYSGDEPIIVDAEADCTSALINAIESLLVLETAERELKEMKSDQSLPITFRSFISDIFHDYKPEFSKFKQFPQAPNRFSKYGVMGLSGNETK